MFVFTSRIRIKIGMSFSLKDKRQVVRRIKDKFMAAFKVPLVEIEEQDTLNIAVVAYTFVGGDLRKGRQLQQKMVGFIEDNCHEEVVGIENFEDKY